MKKKKEQLARFVGMKCDLCGKLRSPLMNNVHTHNPDKTPVGVGIQIIIHKQGKEEPMFCRDCCDSIIRSIPMPPEPAHAKETA
jgi:hypothetical protein